MTNRAQRRRRHKKHKRRSVGRNLRDAGIHRKNLEMAASFWYAMIDLESKSYIAKRWLAAFETDLISDKIMTGTQRAGYQRESKCAHHDWP